MSDSLSNAQSFILDLGRIADTLPEEQMADLLHSTALSALASIVRRSPVGNPDLWQSPAPKGYVGGQFRGNWFVSIGAPQPQVSPRTDKSGTASIGAGEAVIRSAPAYALITIHNSLPYATALEHGHSSQAPLGMVGLTLAEIQSGF